MPSDHHQEVMIDTKRTSVVLQTNVSLNVNGSTIVNHEYDFKPTKYTVGAFIINLSKNKYSFLRWQPTIAPGNISKMCLRGCEGGEFKHKTK